MQFEKEHLTPEEHSVRTQAEFCIHDEDSDRWVSAESDEKLQRAVTQDQQDEKYSDALSDDSEWG